MKRSIEFPCDPRWIRNPTNSPLATIGQRMAAASRTKKAIAAVQAILSAHFLPPTLSQAPISAPYADPTLLLKPNRWTVRLTRISPGTLDPLTGGASMKAIQDAVARWCGVPDERNPIWTWVEPIGQEKRGQGVYGVRIEIESLEPGEDRIVKLAGLEPRTPKGKRGRPTVGDLHAAAERLLKGGDASDRRSVDRGRERHEATTRPGARTAHPGAGRPPADPGEERAACMLVGCSRCLAKVGEPCQEVPCSPPITLVFGVHLQRAQAAGIHSAQRRPNPAVPASCRCSGCGGKATCWGAYEGSSVEIGKCDRCCSHDQKGRTCKPLRKLATVKPREAWVITPWGRTCSWCDGRLQRDGEICERCAQVGTEPVRWTALDETAPRETWMTVPEKHRGPCGLQTCTRRPGHVFEGLAPCRECEAREKRGARIKMVRREWTRAGVACWLYEPA